MGKNVQSLLVFLIQITLISSNYVPPEEYFINCGSDQNANEARRNFTGDESHHSLSFKFTKHNSSVTTTTQRNNTSTIYNTARVFRQQSSYSFKTDGSPETSTYLVRLHFLASASDLRGAAFDVAASPGVLLLHNFSATLVTDTPLVREFYVQVKADRFWIYFTPRESSLAFVNAIEFFRAPPVEFSLVDADKVGSQLYKPNSSSVLQTVYRINVGGNQIDPDSDEIWRSWGTDGEFLVTKDNAIDAQPFSNELKYPSPDRRFGAPDQVYKTAKEMNIISNNNTNNGSSNLFNITWSFNVNKSSGHVVRAHFCDIIRDSVSLQTVLFNFFINGTFRTLVNTIDNISTLAEPIYFDFVVSPLNSGILNLSIGPSDITTVVNAFLNGLEILEIKQGLASIPEEKDISTNKSKLPIVIGVVSGCFAALCMLAAAVLFLVLRRKRTKPTEHSSWGQVVAFGGVSSHSRVTEATTTINGSPVPNLHLGLTISFSEIQLATKSFNSKLIIGRGGFGNVYKGTLLNGTVVAVKRSNPGGGQGLPEFQTEIMILSSIRHRHLVSLIGYCDEKDEMILVYEFMEKGTLRDHLYNSNLPRLSWKQRLEICIGSASGLNYLHKGSSGLIIHRDVKSTNILLDENLVAKVADFGLSKTGPLDDTTHFSTNVKGTLGYLDPEYFRTQQLTDKSDVYSFGVVLMEVLCARPAIDPALPREQMNLAEWAIRCKTKGVLADIVDSSIKDQINPNSLRKFGETAEKCLQEDSLDRPAMSDVIWDLEYALQLQQMPAAREPHEDTTATASGFSAEFVMPDARRIPSLSSANDDSYLMSTDLTDMSMSEVFSQLKRDGAR